MLGWLLVLFVSSAHAGEPTLTVTIESRDQYTPWNERHIGQVTLEVRFRVDSDQTTDAETECIFRMPRQGMRTTHVAQGRVLAGIPTYGRFRQWVPTGSVGYDKEDWDVDCKAHSLGDR